jgi:hypothetical protein
LLSFASSFFAIAAAFAIPTLASLTIVRGAANYVNARYIAAFALGVYFWFFSDTIADSAYLDRSSGFAGGTPQVALVLIFAIGVLVPFMLDRSSLKPTPETGGVEFGIPLMVALSVGIHGLGEAAAFGAVAASTPYQDFLSAFGGLSPAVAFVIHKALEPLMVGAAYVVYAKEHAKTSLGVFRDLLVVMLAFILPGLIGAATGYSLNYDATYIYALGLGTSIYAAIRMANPLFSPSQTSRWFPSKIALAVVLGFLSLYFAALFHS